LTETVKKVAVFGNAGYATVKGGKGSGDVNAAYTVSISDGLANTGLEVQQALKQQYENNIKAAKDRHIKSADPIHELLTPAQPAPEMEIDPLSASLSAQECDAAIITIGRNAGKGQDRKNVEGDFNLLPVQLNMLENATRAFHANGKQVIVILNIGGVIETASWRDMPDAILLAWQGGQETGNSVADVLTGKVNPSGKLTCTFPMKYENVPSATNFPGIATGPPPEIPAGLNLGWMTGFIFPTPAEITYEEGIYAGHSYYETVGVKTAYEFGFGLSYTQFEYSGLKLAPQVPAGEHKVTFTVKKYWKCCRARSCTNVYKCTRREPR